MLKRCSSVVALCLRSVRTVLTTNSNDFLCKVKRQTANQGRGKSHAKADSGDLPAEIVRLETLGARTPDYELGTRKDRDEQSLCVQAAYLLYLLQALWKRGVCEWAHIGI